MSKFLKSSAVRESVLTALSRMLTLSPTVWRDAGGSFRGSQGDTVTVRVPAYTVADDRTLRSGSTRSRRGLFESAVPVTLSHNLYRDVPLTDENQTLDILDFARQVLNPMLEGIARGIEDALVDDAITDADYEYEVDYDHDNPFASFVEARAHMSNARVPFSDRFLALGSSVAASAIESPRFSAVDQSGANQTLREGVLGRIAGFTVLESPALDPDEGYAYHRTAYALNTQAPVVPQGAPAGFVVNQDGFALRLVQVLDAATIENIVAADVFVGASPVLDAGTIDGKGVFTPAQVPEEDGSDKVFVRGVKLTAGGS